jgi:hypothetical protein
VKLKDHQLALLHRAMKLEKDIASHHAVVARQREDQRETVKSGKGYEGRDANTSGRPLLR